MKARSLYLTLSFAAVSILTAMNTHAFERLVVDFSAETNTVAWQIVNDDVMGGVSKGGMELTNGALVFKGEVSLENNGGFASIRSLPAGYDLAGCDTFVFRARGDGRSYKFTARMDRRADSPIYQASFVATNGWAEYRLPMKEFTPSFRGRVRSGEPLLDAARINSVGFLISDKQQGAFRLEIGWIKAVCMPQTVPPLAR